MSNLEIEKLGAKLGVWLNWNRPSGEGGWDGAESAAQGRKAEGGVGRERGVNPASTLNHPPWRGFLGVAHHR